MKTTLIVLISIFLSLFAIGLTVYVVFFIIHKRYFYKELKIMDEYNKLTGLISSLNMFKLEVLANNNPSVKPNILQIKHQYAILSENLKTIYKSIDILDKEIQAFNLKPAQQNIELINKDLTQSLNDFVLIKNEYERYTSYSDTIAEMFNTYIELNEKLKKFYVTKVIYHSDFKKIIALFDAISKTISTIPNATIKFDFKKAVTVWIDLHRKIQALINALKVVLKFQVVITYLEASMTKNNEIISRCYTSIADSDKQVLQRFSATFDNNYTKLMKAYREFDLNKAHNYAINATQALNQINSFVAVHTKSSDIIAVSLNDIADQTNAILSNKDQIISSIRTIQEYFVKEVQTYQWFEDIVQNINIIEKLADQSKYIGYKTHGQKVSAMTSLVSISKTILAKREETAKLIDNVNESLNKVISTITNLNDLYIYFWQMLVAIKNLSPDDQDTKSIVSLIENNLSLISKYTQEIVTKEDPDYNTISKNINNIVEHIHQIYGKISTNLTLKNYARKLMVYTNRYKSESNKESFLQANKLYRSNKYSECIETLLAICKKAKAKNKKNAG